MKVIPHLPVNMVQEKVWEGCYTAVYLDWTPVELWHNERVWKTVYAPSFHFRVVDHFWWYSIMVLCFDLLEFHTTLVAPVVFGGLTGWPISNVGSRTHHQDCIWPLLRAWYVLTILEHLPSINDPQCPLNIIPPIAVLILKLQLVSAVVQYQVDLIQFVTSKM